jgi:folate-dependent phosphoribosylglycinamide formyltransferase PurN
LLGVTTEGRKAETCQNPESDDDSRIRQVIEEVDGGGTVVQLKVPVVEGETAETLKSKVQKLEGEALIEAIKMYDRDGFLPGGPK